MKSALALITAVSLCATCVAQDSPIFVERKLGVVPDDVSLFSLHLINFSSDGQHTAYRALVGESVHLISDGTRSPAYADVGLDVAFRGSESGFAYTARFDGKAHVVIDGKPGEGFVDADALTYSPDGKRFCYRVNIGGKYDFFGTEGGKFHVVLDGVMGAAYDKVSWPVFRPGGRLYYMAKSGERCFLVIDGKEDSLLPSGMGHSIRFNEDGSHVALECRDRSGAAFSVDGKLTEALDDAGYDVGHFSRDGKRFVFGGSKGGKGHVVIDGKAQECPDCTSATQTAISPDGARFAYAAEDRQERTSRIRVVIGTEVGPWFEMVRNLRFSPDGRHVAYLATEPAGALDDSLYFLVVDGKKATQEFDFIHPPVFSPDGKKLAFGARVGRELLWKVVDLP